MIKNATFLIFLGLNMILYPFWFAITDRVKSNHSRLHFVEIAAIVIGTVLISVAVGGES